MPTSVIDIEDLAKTITEELNQYTGTIIEGMNASGLEVTKETVKALKTAPTPKKYGAYRRSWTYTKKRDHRGNMRYVVHSRAPHYRLTHLLENGHAKRGGGRTKQYPHIRPAEQKAIHNYLKKIERVIKGDDWK